MFLKSGEIVFGIGDGIKNLRSPFLGQVDLTQSRHSGCPSQDFDFLIPLIVVD
jgi:hypothetical protein